MLAREANRIRVAPSVGGGLTRGAVVTLADLLAESAIIAFIGGVIGCLMALPINGVVTSTTNWASFSEIAFAFRVTPQLLLAGLVFAVVMGVVGGFFPARRASKLPVRSRFVDFTGQFVLHCHILIHEDRGMMQLIEVVSDQIPFAHH